MDRFWSKVEKTDGCWLWTASVNAGGGYGRFRVGDRTRRAHRVAYEMLVGPIPDGKQLDHLCGNRRCVRPDHLEPVTGRENVLRGETIAAANAAKTHCPRGHEYTPENTKRARGYRHCRECQRRYKREYAARRRAAA